MKKVYENAMVEYKKTIKKDPTNAQAYFNLSGAYNGLNEGRKSVLCAHKAMELFEKKSDSPNAAKARKRLRELYKTYDLNPTNFDK